MRLHALIDACESSNLLDLPYQLMVRDNQIKVQQTHPGLTQLEAEDLKVGLVWLYSCPQPFGWSLYRHHPHVQSMQFFACHIELLCMTAPCALMLLGTAGHIRRLGIPDQCCSQLPAGT